jgi:hypothetical protein
MLEAPATWSDDHFLFYHVKLTNISFLRYNQTYHSFTGGFHDSQFSAT